MVYDIKNGTEHGAENFLFPALRQTYDDLLDAPLNPARRPAAAGRTELRRSAGGRGDRIPGPATAGAVSFFSALTRRAAPIPRWRAPTRRFGLGRVNPASGAVLVSRKCRAHLRARAELACPGAPTRSSTPSTRLILCSLVFPRLVSSKRTARTHAHTASATTRPTPATRRCRESREISHEPLRGLHPGLGACWLRGIL